MSPKVQVILMSRNRPDYICKSVESILAQTYANIDFFISDNSTEPAVESLIRQKYPSVQYVRRGSALTMTEHWSLIISEVNSEYFMMFHDDDEMKPECVDLLVSALINNPRAVACAGNAHIIQNATLTSKLHNNILAKSITFETIYDFGLRYFNSQLGGVNPFPGYLYRTSALKKVDLKIRQAGKHTDVAILFKAILSGPIIWLSDVTMNYRVHKNNISVGIDILSLVKLVKFYRKIGLVEKDEPSSTEFIIKNYLLWLKQVGFLNFMKKHPTRFKIILFNIFKYFIFSPRRSFCILFKRWLPQ